MSIRVNKTKRIQRQERSLACRCRKKSGCKPCEEKHCPENVKRKGGPEARHRVGREKTRQVSDGGVHKSITPR
ncbi:hypothetical protein K0M31_005102 [Melipona bicolor]|uniref:Uncharacterized protein n=1 Tax=Melipona bicolor TaxID=60889 RepID=A0AA40FWT8_9HYME|nr:hypothetical protein K0M31_005102 [Melipona bicolor]